MSFLDKYRKRNADGSLQTKSEQLERLKQKVSLNNKLKDFRKEKEALICELCLLSNKIALMTEKEKEVLVEINKLSDVKEFKK